MDFKFKNMKNFSHYSLVGLFSLGMLTASLGFTSCSTDDDDVSWLISNTNNGEEDSEVGQFKAEGTWVMTNPQLSFVLGEDIELGPTIESALIGLLNENLPIQFDSFADMELGVKIAPSETEGKVALSCGLLDLLVSPQKFALELDKVSDWEFLSQNGLSNLVGEVTLMNFVTDEKPDGITIDESPLGPIIKEKIGDFIYNLMVKDKKIRAIKYQCLDSSLRTTVVEELQTGKMNLAINGKIALDGDKIMGMDLALDAKASLSMDMIQWTSLDDE